MFETFYYKKAIYKNIGPKLLYNQPVLNIHPGIAIRNAIN